MNNRTAYYSTNDLNLAAALLSIGVETAKEPFTVHRSIKSEQKIYTFYFKEVSNCGKYRTSELIKIWNDPELYNNSEHPFAYMKCLIENRNGLLDVINKAVEFITIEKNGKILVITKGASQELQDKLFKLL